MERCAYWLMVCSLTTAACGGSDSATSSAGGTGQHDDRSGSGGDTGLVAAGSGGRPAAGSGGRAAAGAGTSAGSGTYMMSTDDRPAAGNPDGHCSVPMEAALADVSKPTTKVGTGTPASCTGAAFVSAVASGGVITFDCGTAPVTITLQETAKVFNDANSRVVIDGGGKVTLSGADKVRILYQNTCDEAQHWTTSHCDNQADPELTVQNITFEHGSAKGLKPDGGGAIFARGGRLKIINTRFFNNRCDDTGPDIGGAGVRAFDQADGKPLYVVNSTFGGRTDLGNVCSNGGGLSSIGVSYTVLNSLFGYNRAIGQGANPMRSGTPGGGSGGAIYNDGNNFTLTLCGTRIEQNQANEGGGAIFFVSNDHSGSLVIEDSVLHMNPNAGFDTAGYPGIFVLDRDDKPAVTRSTID